MGKFFLISVFAVCAVVFAAPSFSQLSSDTPAQGALDRASDDMRYDNAFQFFRLQQFRKAEILFQEYLEIYTDGAHREEAFDGLASIYFDRYDYRKALKMYLAHFEEYSDTEEGVRAYYNAGICYSKMGNRKQAQEIFTRIGEDYPQFQAAASARMQLDVQDVLK